MWFLRYFWLASDWQKSTSLAIGEIINRVSPNNDRSTAAIENNDTSSDDLARLRQAFRDIWGYSDFRAPQGEIAQAILDKQDIIVVIPTGSGKSVCFQLPALMQSGVTLVVSPLVALMENQVQELREKRLSAAALHSELGKRERSRTLQLLAQNRLRLLYLSPETLLSKPVWEILVQPLVKINALVLDEAHCLTQWGDSFRPAYRRLGAVRSALLAAKPKGDQIAIATFTATADPTTQQALHTVLELRKPRLVCLNPYRSNLQLGVQIVWTPKGRRQALLKFVQQQKRQSGLIYARTRRGTEALAKWLASKRYSVKAYHGGLSATRRRQIESEWIKGSCELVVCTSAFGMGINKPDCRFVVHYEVPSLISEYVQEIGRGGRDGQPAVALSLVSEPSGLFAPEDQRRWKFFEQKAQQMRQSARQIVKQIPSSGNIDSVRSQFKDCDQALALLHRAGQLQWKDPFNYQILTSPRRQIEQAPSPTAIMRRYLFTKRCRWQILLEAFGFADEAKSMQCGKCDRCLTKK